MLAQFKAGDLLAEAVPAPEGVPMQVPLLLIDFDPAQPRRTVDTQTLAELAESIRTHGVLEPVSLRRSQRPTGRYVVNRGERRVRAALSAGLASIPAFLDARIDPYAQAAENLHRENMSPFDLARFIAEREREGHTRAEIARRLNKPRSFISEAAALIDAPAEVRSAFDAGRLGTDLRVLYQLSLAARTDPEKAAALLQGSGPITRGTVEALLARTSGGRPLPPSLPSGNVPGRAAHASSGGRTVLVVEHKGRRGTLRLKARDNDMAEVRFGDGSCGCVRLQELRLVCWATEEQSLQRP
jgi:ParB family chromosome partitioning protein